MKFEHMLLMKRINTKSEYYIILSNININNALTITICIDSVLTSPFCKIFFPPEILFYRNIILMLLIAKTSNNHFVFISFKLNIDLIRSKVMSLQTGNIIFKYLVGMIVDNVYHSIYK